MAHDFVVPDPFSTELPDGTPVLVEPAMVPDLDDFSIDAFRQIWTVRLTGDPVAPRSAWPPPLAVDFAPELALEEAWIELLIQRGQHLRGGSGLPLRPRFVALEIEHFTGHRFLRRVTACAFFDTLPEAREGFELLAAQRVSAGTWAGRLHLFDRKDRRGLDTTSPGGIAVAGESQLVRQWLRPRRGEWTGGAESVPTLPKPVLCGIGSGERLTPVPSGIQAAIDRVIAWAHERRTAWAALRRVTGYIEQEGLGAPSDCFLALPASRLPLASELEVLVDDEEVREHLGLRTTRPVTDNQRIRFYAEVVVPRLLASGDEQCRTIGYLTVTASDRRTALLPFDYEGAMMSADSTYEWLEPARDRAAMVANLEKQRWIVDSDRWMAMSPAGRRRFFEP
jgi:hypothetical protein